MMKAAASVTSERNIIAAIHPPATAPELEPATVTNHDFKRTNLRVQIGRK